MSSPAKLPPNRNTPQKYIIYDITVKSFQLGSIIPKAKTEVSLSIELRMSSSRSPYSASLPDCVGPRAGTCQPYTTELRARSYAANIHSATYLYGMVN